MAKVNVSIPNELLEEVDSLAAELHRSRSGLVQEATAHYVTQVRAERERAEREKSIREATRDMRRLADLLPPGEDGTALIRRDRDSRDFR